MRLAIALMLLIVALLSTNAASQPGRTEPPGHQFTALLY
jgi:hypothetical protein